MRTRGERRRLGGTADGGVMTNEEQEDLTAELLVSQQALVFIIRSLSALAEKEGIPRELFFRT